MASPLRSVLALRPLWREGLRGERNPGLGRCVFILPGRGCPGHSWAQSPLNLAGPGSKAKARVGLQATSPARRCVGPKALVTPRGPRCKWGVVGSQIRVAV